jgi:DNA ligase 1
VEAEADAGEEDGDEQPVRRSKRPRNASTSRAATKSKPVSKAKTASKAKTVPKDEDGVIEEDGEAMDVDEHKGKTADTSDTQEMMNVEEKVGDIEGTVDDDMASIDGVKPHVYLQDGEEIEASSQSKGKSKGSGTVYKIKRTWDHYYWYVPSTIPLAEPDLNDRNSSCPAWRNQVSS